MQSNPDDRPIEPAAVDEAIVPQPPAAESENSGLNALAEATDSSTDTTVATDAPEAPEATVSPQSLAGEGAAAPAQSHHPPLIEWKTEYNIGIDIVDSQHQEIVTIINKLYFAVRYGKRDAAFIPEIISELKQYVAMHFKTEEKLHAGTQFPEAIPHREEHRKFVMSVLQLEKDYKTSIVELRGVLEMVKTWFMQHTQVSDRRFADYLSKRENAS